MAVLDEHDGQHRRHVGHLTGPVHDLAGRREALDAAQIGNGRWQELDFAIGLAGQGVPGTDPDGGDGLGLVVAGDLPGRGCRDEESGVVPARRQLRRYPVADVVDRVNRQHQVLPAADVEQAELLPVHCVPVVGEAGGHLRVGGVEEGPGVPAVLGVSGQHHPGLLEALAQRGDPEGQPARFRTRGRRWHRHRSGRDRGPRRPARNPRDRPTHPGTRTPPPRTPRPGSGGACTLRRLGRPRSSTASRMSITVAAGWMATGTGSGYCRPSAYGRAGVHSGVLRPDLRPVRAPWPIGG